MTTTTSKIIQPDPNVTIKEHVERQLENFHHLIDLTQEKLPNEIEESIPRQYSLIKYFANHPEKIGMVSDEEIFEREPRNIFVKLKKYVESLKGTSEPFNLVELFATFDFADKSVWEFYIKDAEEPDSEFNARQICDDTRRLHNKVIKANACLSIMKADDEESVAIYAKQLTRTTESTPAKAKIFTLDTELPRTRYTLKHKGVPILEESNFYILMGKEKSGKSHILSVFLAAYLFGIIPNFQLESMIGAGERILYIDTEQSASDALNICQTANLLAGKRYNEPTEMLTIASCGEVPHSQMLPEIIGLVEQYRPKVLFLDGYAGLLEDAYQTTGADPLMQEVLRLARHYDLVIIGVFHSKTEENPLSSSNTPNVNAFGAFGRACQRYGGGTFYVENKEGRIKIEQLQARKKKCPTIYCKLDGVIYIDVPERDEPDVCPVTNGNTDEVLRPRHLDINDACVHSFVIPHYLTEDEYIEGEDLADIEQQKRDEERKAQKAQHKMESDKDKYRIKLAIIFHTDDETLSRNDMRGRWYEYGKDQEMTDKLTGTQLNKWKKSFCRLIKDALALNLLDELPNGAYRLINLPYQNQTS